MYDEVILANNFSKYGASQLNYDVTRVLFTIFSDLTETPAVHFPLVAESLVILTLHRPAAFLLRDALKDHQAVGLSDSKVRCLEEMGVFGFGVTDVLTLINIRTNMASL